MKLIPNQLKHIFQSKAVKNGSLFAIYSFFNKGIAFILLTVLAGYIGPSDYGELSLFNTFVMLLSYFVGLSTSGYMSVSFFKKESNQFNKDFSAICIITIIVTTIISIFFSVASNILTGLLKLSTTFLFIGLIISFSNTFVSLNLDYLRVKENLKWYGIVSCGFAIANFIFSLYLVIVKKYNWHGQVYSLLICNVFFSLIALFFFLHNKLLCIPKSWKIYKRIILWGLPIIPHLASGWIKQGLDRYIIVSSHDMSDVGLFSFALTLTSVIIMIGVAFNQTNSVNLYQTLSSSESPDQKSMKLRKKERLLFVLYLGLVLCIMIGGATLIPLLMPRYSSCIPYFLILSVYGFFQCIYFLLCNYLFYYDNTKQLMYITFGSALVHLLLSLWLTRYSLYYTCLIYVISIVIVDYFVFVQSRKLLKCNLR